MPIPDTKPQPKTEEESPSHSSHESHNSQESQPESRCLRCRAEIADCDLAEGARWCCMEKSRKSFQRDITSDPFPHKKMRAVYACVFEAHAEGALPPTWQLRGATYDTAATIRAASALKFTEPELDAVLRDLYHLVEYFARQKGDPIECTKPESSPTV